MLKMPLDVEKPASFHVPRHFQIYIWCSSRQTENQRTVESFVAEIGTGPANPNGLSPQDESCCWPIRHDERI